MTNATGDFRGEEFANSGLANSTAVPNQDQSSDANIYPSPCGASTR